MIVKKLNKRITLLKEKVMYAVKREGQPLLKELKNGPFFYRY